MFDYSKTLIFFEKNYFLFSKKLFYAKLVEKEVLYMKKIILAILANIGISFAGEINCNNGTSNVEGIPETSCVATSSNFTFGLLQYSGCLTGHIGIEQEYL